MSDLFQELKQADSLPSPPGVALEILRLNRQDDVEIEDLDIAQDSTPTVYLESGEQVSPDEYVEDVTRSDHVIIGLTRGSRGRRSRLRWWR